MASGGPATATASAAMLSSRPARTDDTFYRRLHEGQQNWQNFCARSTKAQQLDFLGQKHESLVVHVGTHGQISVEFFNRSTNLEINPQIHLGLDGTIGCRRDVPARFQRFELPPDVKTLRVHEGAIAPGVCFSDEHVSLETMMAVLKQKDRSARSAALVASMNTNIKDDKDPDYEVDISTKELLHPTRELYKHHWQQRIYTPQTVSLTDPTVDRSNYPIMKRFITSVEELKTAGIRLLEWHIVAFMIYEGKFLVIDLNPYLFENEITMAHLRSRTTTSRARKEGDPSKSDVDYRSAINTYLMGVTNTSRIVALFYRTEDITIVDSTCSVLRLKVRDGAKGNQLHGSDDGVIDSFDMRRYKLKLNDLLSSVNPSDYRRKINRLAQNILDWYRDKHVLIPQKIINSGVGALSLKEISDMLTTISYDSIWIKPLEFEPAMVALLEEIKQYMGKVISKEKNDKLMNWIGQYLRTNFRQLNLIANEKARLEKLKESQADDDDADDDDDDDDDDAGSGSPLAALANTGEYASNTSSFGERLTADDLLVGEATRNKLRGKIRRIGGKKTKTRRVKRNKSRNFRNKSRSKSRSRRTRRRVIKRKNN
jgi:hypothetical protein